MVRHIQCKRRNLLCNADWCLFVPQPMLLLQLESVYTLAIVNDRSIRSLRDLDGSHVKLLKNIRCVLKRSKARTNSNANTRSLFVCTPQ